MKCRRGELEGKFANTMQQNCFSHSIQIKRLKIMQKNLQENKNHSTHSEQQMSQKTILGRRTSNHD